MSNIKFTGSIGPRVGVNGTPFLFTILVSEVELENGKVVSAKTPDSIRYGFREEGGVLRLLGFDVSKPSTDTFAIMKAASDADDQAGYE